MQLEQPVNILMVDDQPENLMALEAVLDDLGQNLVRAQSGNEALKKLLNDEYAIVILDVMMPGMNGFELASLIRQRESTRHTPIIFLTAMYSEDSDCSVAYSLGAVDFIVKPFVSEILKSKVSVFVDLFKKTREIQRQAELIAEIEKKRAEEEKERLEAEKQLIRQELVRQEMEKELLEERSRQLQKADRLKTEFLANMSHEIRTPMNGVVGMAELLLHTPLSTEQREFARIIRESAQALLIIINDILDLSKIEAGRLELELIDFELVSLIEGTAELLSEQARDKRLTVMTYIDPGLPAGLRGDSGRLRQVLLNLIGNAMKFTDKGQVVVEACRVNEGESLRSSDQSQTCETSVCEPPPVKSDTVGEDGDGAIGDGAIGAGGDDNKVVTASNLSRGDLVVVRFSVKDTGIGLSQEELKRLFRPFSQADGSTTRRFGGTGLGLSISKRLVNLMGGDIGVTSTPGSGSTFWFEVPFAVVEVVPEPAREGLEKTRVLVIDDQPSARIILKSYINSWNMECTVSGSVDDGLSTLRDEMKSGTPFDIIISDLMMPDLDGFKLLEAVKNDDALKDTPVFLCTGVDSKGQGERALELGFSAYLTKPVQQSRLFNSIAKVMNPHECESLKEPVEAETTAETHDEGLITVLVAEDNVVNQKVAILQLKKLGFTAIAVATGKEAVEEVMRKKYAVALMDCQMPEMDGFEATNAIRKAETLTGRHIPIIGLTAHAMEGDRERCIAAGMDDYLSKPTTLDKLSKMMKKWIGEESSQPSASPDIKDFDAILPEDLVQDLIPLFLDSARLALTEIEEAFEKQAATDIVAKAHELKGSAAGVGANRVSSASKELEMSGQIGDWQKMREHFSNLKSDFARFSNMFSQTLSSK